MPVVATVSCTYELIPTLPRLERLRELLAKHPYRGPSEEAAGVDADVTLAWLMLLRRFCMPVWLMLKQLTRIVFTRSLQFLSNNAYSTPSAC